MSEENYKVTGWDIFSVILVAALFSAWAYVAAMNYIDKKFDAFELRLLRDQEAWQTRTNMAARGEIKRLGDFVDGGGTVWTNYEPYVIVRTNFNYYTNQCGWANRVDEAEASNIAKAWLGKDTNSANGPYRYDAARGAWTNCYNGREL